MGGLRAPAAKASDPRDCDGVSAFTIAACTSEWYRGTFVEACRFRDVWLQAFFLGDTRSRRIPSDVETRLFRKLQMIDDATTDQDLRSPPSNHFEKLRGEFGRLCSIRVNDHWRPIFRWDRRRGEAEGVYLDDQSYR